MFDSEQVTGHIRLFRAFLEIHLTHQDPPAYAPVFKWIARPEQGHSEVWVCGWNRPRLLERIAGAFLSAQINILSAGCSSPVATAWPSTSSVCCSTQFSPVTSARDITRVETRLCDSLAFEDYDFSPLLNKERCCELTGFLRKRKFPRKSSWTIHPIPSFTLIDIRTPTVSDFSTICCGPSVGRYQYRAFAHYD